MSSEIKIDVNIVTYESVKFIKGVLGSLLAQDIGASSISLCIVDNSKTDETLQCVREFLDNSTEKFGSVSIKKSPKNLGFGNGHNLAATMGSSPFIFILNPDVELPPDCLSVLFSKADAAGQKFALFEPRQIPYEHPKFYDPVTMDPTWSSGAAMLIRRSAFVDVGGFDPRIFLYGEDVDLSWRLRAKGYKLLYVPEATITHYAYAEPGEIKPVQVRNSLLANLYLRTRFGSPKDVFFGFYIYCKLLASPETGPRRQLIGMLGAYFWNYAYFRRGGWWRKYKPSFHGWDYSPVRRGAFIEVIPASALPVHPKVSVLIRTIGRKPLLRRALQTVSNQTYPDVEVVLVEDGPGTLDDLASEFPALDIKYYPLGEKRGRCAAGNEAMNRATGEYYVFLDEDDEFFADHIEQLVAYSIEASSKIIYSAAFERKTQFSEMGDSIAEEGSILHPFAFPFSYTRLSVRNYIPILAVLFHRSIYEKYGGFDLDLDYLEDWNLWVRYAVAYGPFAFLDKTTCLYRVPMVEDQYDKRSGEIMTYDDKALSKQANLSPKVTMGMLGKEYNDIDKFLSEANSIQGTDSSIINKAMRRHTSLRLIMRALIRILVKFAG